MIKFKYFTFTSGTILTGADLNVYGDKGYELVQIITVPNKSYIHYVYTFIKQLPILKVKVVKKNVLQRKAGTEARETPQKKTEGAKDSKGNDETGSTL